MIFIKNQNKYLIMIARKILRQDTLTHNNEERRRLVYILKPNGERMTFARSNTRGKVCAIDCELLKHIKTSDYCASICGPMKSNFDGTTTAFIKER